MSFQRIENIEVRGKRVFVLSDLNFNGNAMDSIKLNKFLPTIDLLSRKGAKIILANHSALSDRASILMDALKNFGKSLKIGETNSLSEISKISPTLSEGDIYILPNLNQFPEDEKNDKSFAEELSKIADIYVNDAFSIANKKLASNDSITEFLPSYAGTLFHREYETLNNLLNKPDKPYIAMIGGSKVSSKIKILNSLLNRANTILVGGGLAYTFLKARAVPVGSSVIEKDFEVLSHQFIDKAGIAGVEFQMPVDHVISDIFGEKGKTKNVDRMGILDGWMGMDIGSKTLSAYEKILKNAGTIFWTGSFGVTELEKFSTGSVNLAKILSKTGAKTVLSGENTINAVLKAGVESKITHISTGGEATIEFLEGKSLPAIKALGREKDTE